MIGAKNKAIRSLIHMHDGCFDMDYYRIYSIPRTCLIASYE